MILADTRHVPDSSSQTVSALGLRWAALRGMLSSPLIMGDEQRPLRDELVRELATLEQDFVSLQARNIMEVSAKIDIAKSALRDGLQAGQGWLANLLESIQGDLHAVNAKQQPSPVRPPVNLQRTHTPRPEGASASAEAEASSTS
jgi:hypothetical protein